MTPAEKLYEYQERVAIMTEERLAIVTENGVSQERAEDVARRETYGAEQMELLEKVGGTK